MDLAKTLFYESAMAFASLPAGIFYDDAWTKNSAFLDFVAKGEQILQFAFCAAMEGANDKEIAHIIGEFHLIAQEAIKFGDFFFSINMAENKVKLWTKNFKGALEIFRANKSYNAAEKKVHTVYDSDDNFDLSKKEEGHVRASGRPIAPYLPLYTREMRFLFESNRLHILSMGNHFITMIFAMRYWLTLHEGEFSPSTNFLDEVSRHEVLDNDALYELMDRRFNG